MTPKRMVRLLPWLIMLPALVAPASADVSAFKLMKAMPADASMAVHYREHEGLEFLNKQMMRVWKVVEEQNFERDLRMFMKSMYEQGQPEADMEEFEQRWQEFSDLLMAIDWEHMCEQEFAFGMRMGFPFPEYLFLCLASPEVTENNYKALTSLLERLVAMSGEESLQVNTEGEGPSAVTTLLLPVPIPGASISLYIARHEGTLLMAFGQSLPEQSLALLRGEPGKTLASTERFQEAVKKLPAPGEELFFMDVSRFLGGLRTMIDKYSSMGDPNNERPEKVRELPNRIFDALDIFDYLVSVSNTQGKETRSESLATLTADAKSKPLYAVLFSNGTLEEPLKYIPKSAQDMSVWSGMDPEKAYEAILSFIRQHVPDGEQMLTDWEDAQVQMKEETGLAVKEDLLAWIGGQFRTFTIPGRGEFEPGKTVFMISVEDEEKAREMLNRLYEAVEPMIQQQNGMIDDANIEGAEGFKVIVLPALAMMLGQPTLGVKNGQLFIGIGTQGVAAAIQTAEGSEPNFAQNERFQKEGLKVDGNVYSMSFSDLTKMGEQLGQMLQMAPMIGMFAPDVTKNPVGRMLLSVAGKLGKVVRELNFFQSSCALTTFDGKVLHTKMVTNYRDPGQTRPASEEGDTDQ